MSTIAEEQRYERKLKFFHERLQTCGYRFHNMVQTRRKEIPKLGASYKNQGIQSHV